MLLLCSSDVSVWTPQMCLSSTWSRRSGEMERVGWTRSLLMMVSSKKPDQLQLPCSLSG